MVDIGRFLIGQGVSCRKRSNNRASRPDRSVNSPGIAHLYHFAERLRFFVILAMLETRSKHGIERGSANQKGRPDWPFSLH
jgi:hypothetical protein